MGTLLCLDTVPANIFVFVFTYIYFGEGERSTRSSLCCIVAEIVLKFVRATLGRIFWPPFIYTQLTAAKNPKKTTSTAVILYR